MTRALTLCGMSVITVLQGDKVPTKGQSHPYVVLKQLDHGFLLLLLSTLSLSLSLSPSLPLSLSLSLFLSPFFSHPS